MNKQNKRELLRALFDSYKSRIMAGLGFNLETVMNDRLMSFKSITKKELEGCFSTSIFFIFIFYCLYINFIKMDIVFFFLLAFCLGFLTSNIRIFLLKSITPIQNKHHEIAFKKAMYDVYFETVTSAHIIYYVFAGVLLILIGSLFFFTTTETFYYADVAIHKIVKKFNLVFFTFRHFIIDFLSSILFFLLGSYSYIHTYIYQPIKKITKESLKNDNQ
jgi:hypothetical protein